MSDAHAVMPPREVLALAKRPRLGQFDGVAFERRCIIPTTAPIDVRWPPPRWPAGVPRPSTVIATFRPIHRVAVQGQLDQIAAWNSKTVNGQHAPRPTSRSWSNSARLPWLQHLVMDFRDGSCRLLGAHRPTLESAMHKAAFLWELRNYRNKRLVSFIVHGVRLGDELALDTTIAPNLFSLLEVAGGPDAVADKMHVLKLRGWYSSSAGTRQKGEVAEPGPTLILTSPARIFPRGAVPRKDGGPPRGVAEQGHPRQEELMRDAQTPVESLNASSGEGNALFPQKEIKPRIEDSCTNFCILDALAETLDEPVLALLFDYKYFFHQFVYEMAEIWKMGFALPARKAEGGAHASVLDMLIELVLSMGWTRASLIAQELADSIVWLLGCHVAAALEGYIEEQRRARPTFDKLWIKRLAIRHNYYGSHARLKEALQYTDDKLCAMVGPTAAAVTIVCFCKLIGPVLWPM